MNISPDSVNEILSYLVSQNEIENIYIHNNNRRIIPIIEEKQQQQYPCNNSNSKRVLRNNDFTHIKYLQSLNSGEEIAWNHDLTGKDILIGIGDSGLDVYHCMFYDKNNEVVFDAINMNHRKVVEYFPYYDEEDSKYILFDFII